MTNAQYLAQLRQQQQQQQQHQQQQQQHQQQHQQHQQQQQQQQRQQQYNNNHHQLIQQRPSQPGISVPIAFQQPSNSNPVYPPQPINPSANLNLRNQFQQEYNRLLASQQFANQLNNPSLNEEIPVFFTQPDDGRQPPQSYQFEPAPATNPTKTNSYQFDPAPANNPTKTNSYQFEPAPATNPTKTNSYKFEPAPSKPTYKFEPAPPKPTFKFEPAPPKPIYKFESAPSKPAYKFESSPTKPPQFLPTQPTTRHTTYNYLKKKKAALTTTTPATTTHAVPNRLRYKFKSTTESPKPQVSIRPTQLFIKPDRQKLFQQLVEAQQKQSSTTTTAAPRPAKSNVLEFDSEDALRTHIQQQLKSQGLLDEIKGTIPATNDQIDALPNLDFLSNSNSSSPIYLPNGQNIKIIQVPSKIDPGTKKPTPQIKTIVINQPTTTTSTTTVKPPELLLKELTRGLPGDFEIIRQNQDGGLEELGKVPNGIPQKKVTFVILEEQPDGSLRVQGVRGNENSKDNNGEDVQSIIKKIEKGEIKLPKSTKVEDPDHPSYLNSLANATPEESVESPSYVKHSGKAIPKQNTFQPTPSTNYFDSSTKPSFNYNFGATKTTTPAPFYQSTVTLNPTYSTNSFANSHAGPVVSLSSSKHSSSPSYHVTTTRTPSSVAPFLPTVPADFNDNNYYSTNSLVPTVRTTTYAPPSVSTTSHYSQVNVSPQDSFDEEIYKQIYQDNTVFQSNNDYSQTLADASATSNQVYQPEVINQQVDLSFTTTEPVPIQQVVVLWHFISNCPILKVFKHHTSIGALISLNQYQKLLTMVF